MAALEDLVYSISFQTNASDLRLMQSSTNSLDRNINNASNSMRGLDRNTNSTSSTLKTLGKVVAGAFVTKKVFDFGKASAQTFMDFEQSMANVKATMGGVSNQDFEALKNAAKEAGRTTMYTAKESADALNYMALAGFDTKQSIESLPKVLNLAAAGGMDLARASDLVTDGMSALGLQTKDLDMFIDQMARTSQRSNTNVNQLGEAILTVGSVAKDAGLDTASMNTELGILANAGKKGAEGGTALRNILLNLTAPTKKVSDQLNKLGVKTTDANGKIRPLNNILLDLKNKTKGFTEGQQQAIKAMIGGKENVAALTILMDGAGKGYDDLKKKILDSNGAAKAMADDQKNTVSGAFKELQSALQDLQISLFDTTGSGKKLQDIIRGITNIIPKVKDGFAKFGSILNDVVFPVVIDFKNYVETSLIPKFKEIGNQLANIYNTYLPETSNGFSNLKKVAGTLVDTGLNLVIAALKWIANNKGLVLAAVIGLTTAWTIQTGILIALNIQKAYHQVVTLLNVAADHLETAAIIGLYTAEFVAEGATKLLTAAQWLLNAAMNASPVVRVIGFIILLATVFITAYNNSETFRNGVNSLWESLKSGAETAVNFVVGKINWLIEKANSAIGFLNKIPGVNIGKIGDVGYVNFTGEKHAKTPTNGSVKQTPKKNTSPFASPYIPMYASGVNSKPFSGPALVGENGPEIVNINRGDSVTPNYQTRSILNRGSGGGMNVNSPIIINIHGNADSDTVNDIRTAVKEELESVFRTASVQLGYTEI
ncbi:phage tail tape measure protein [Clostridium brassicae]|uniref:Phage tail tape measure protein n=1 Tax=Clostridium brassicae TaxID=2999072 RepID=A0ABT4D6I1_9CLOT|nr:phage tail tape measure protein [Clostridium brassicae]MCY6957898.1 phage tail tape measure protein [Clostridium brassicae]